MASFVSIGFFSTPLSAPRNSTQEMCCRSNMGRLSSHATFPKAPKLLASWRSSRGTSSVNQWHRDHSAIPSRNLVDAISCGFGVDSCTDRVIAGFWVGPDIDDGWGFVEAFINQTL
ncbi:uncharacterized protein LOC125315097 [Rhodamnia argentea]|uniref:Uncharacterized protein LOC125315097 n=1 Tax=Rhodamnia argentea TaxID=178133 RepID=A0ABM3HEV7_9MYRT|nr:uncharacterized protein LOC125315097 [Rhodamnia argentea]